MFVRAIEIGDGHQNNKYMAILKRYPEKAHITSRIMTSGNAYIHY